MMDDIWGDMVTDIQCDSTNINWCKVAENAERIRMDLERLTAERDSARAWARLWKRAATLNRQAMDEYLFSYGCHNQRRILVRSPRVNTRECERVIRRALRLDDPQ